MGKSCLLCRAPAPAGCLCLSPVTSAVVFPCATLRVSCGLVVVQDCFALPSCNRCCQRGGRASKKRASGRSTRLDCMGGCAGGIGICCPHPRLMYTCLHTQRPTHAVSPLCSTMSAQGAPCTTRLLPASCVFCPAGWVSLWWQLPCLGSLARKQVHELLGPQQRMVVPGWQPQQTAGCLSCAYGTVLAWIGVWLGFVRRIRHPF